MTAGVLLSRVPPTGASARELAIVHRPRYDDWTWPKGGVEPGEHPAVTAAREAREETGFAVTLGHRLGKTRYARAVGSTEVHWWSATPRPEIAPGALDAHEVDQMRWVSVEEATAMLTYPADQIPLAAWKKQGPAQPTVIVARHARAGDRKLWSGPDATRPLDEPGRSRALRLATILSVFAPSQLISATPVRCRETLEPLATTLGKTVVIDQRWDDATWRRAARPAARAIAEVANSPVNTVVCSQGDTIPGVLAELAHDRATKSARASVRRSSNSDNVPRSKKGSFWVLSFNEGELVAADYVAD